jgi:hypothetical protein
MRPRLRPLSEVCAEMPDFRHTRGQRHPLTALLARACRAMRCGARSDSAMAAWGRNDGAQRAQALGCTRTPPCAATLHTILRRRDREVLAAQRGAWAEGRCTETPAPEGAEEAIAVDGTTRRGRRKQGAPGAQLLSARTHRVGLPLAQHAVAEKTNALPVVMELLRHVVREGRGVTRDALLTQRPMAQQTVDAGGDSVMIVKDNQPH